MADDIVPASPILRKTQKRQSSILKRRAKRRRGKTGNVSEVSVSELANEETIQHAVENEPIEDSPRYSVLSEKAPEDIGAFYWPVEEQEAPANSEHIDIFAEVRLLEEANKLPLGQTSRIPPELVDDDDLITFDMFSQPTSGGHSKEVASSPKLAPPDTQFATETELLRVCQVHSNAPKFSQWGSPFAKLSGVATSTPDHHQQKNRHDVSLNSKAGTSFANTPPNRVTSFQEPGTSYARLKHSRDLEQPARKRINFYDSDSKSSVSSGLSVQNDEGVQATPFDAVDLNESQHVQENLQNLSSFFSQSLVQDDVDLTTNGIFRYIMMLKSKRKSARMVHWFRSGQNFALNRTGSSRSFKGFDDDEQVVDSSAMSSDRAVIDELLENGVDCFAKVSAEMEEGNGTGYGMDIESILNSADDVLFRASQLVRGNEGDVEVGFRIQNCGKERGANDVDIDNLLHGHILSTPLFNKFSESTMGDSSPMQWVMRPKLNNSITASDIESELKNANPISNDNFNSTFTINKSISSFDHNDDSLGNITEIHLPHVDPDLDQRVDAECEKELNNVTMLDERQRDEENPFAIPDVPGLNLHEVTKSSKPVVDPKFGPCPVFTSASRKSITISKNALKIAERMMDDIMLKEFDDEMMLEEYNKENTVNMPTIDRTSKKFSKLLSTAFHPTADRSLYVSHTAQRRAEKLTAECDTDRKKLNLISNNMNREYLTKRFNGAHGNFDARAKATLWDPLQKGCSSRDHAMNSNVENSGLIIPDHNQLAPPIGFEPRFRTASKKDILVSENARQKATKMMLEEMRLEDENVQDEMPQIVDPANIGIGLPCPVFTTALGSEIRISESAAQRAAKIMAEFDDPNDDLVGMGIKTMSEPDQTEKHLDKVVAIPTFAGLPFSSERSLPPINHSGNEPAPAAPPIGFEPRFRTASEKDISISKNARQKAMKMMLEEMRLEGENVQDEIPEIADAVNIGNELPCPVFTTALGSEIKISESAAQRAATMMAEFDESNDDLVGMNTKTDQTEKHLDKVVAIPTFARPPFSSKRTLPLNDHHSVNEGNDHPPAAPPVGFEPRFRTASKKDISISKNARQRAMKMMLEEMRLEDDQNEVPEIVDAANIGNELACPVFKTALGSEIKISENAAQRAAKIMAEFGDSNDDLVNSYTQGMSTKTVMKPDQTEERLNKKCMSPSKTLSCGFKMAFRSSSETSESAHLRARAAKIMADDDSFSEIQESHDNSDTKQSKTDFKPIYDKTSGLLTTRFQWASRKPIQVSAKALSIAKQMMGEEEDEILGNMKLTPANESVKKESNENKIQERADPILEPENPPKRVLRPRLAAMKSGLTSRLSNSSTANVPLKSRSSLKMHLRNMPEMKSSDSEIKSEKLSSVPATHASSSKSNAPAPDIELGIITPTRATSSLAISPLPETRTPLRPTPSQKESGKRLSLTRKKFKPPTVITSGNSNTPMRPISLHMQLSTPNFNDFFHSAETSTPKNANRLRGRQKFSLTQEVSASTAALLLDDEAESRDNDSGVRKISWDLGVDESSTNVTINDKRGFPFPDVLEKRARKREEQLQMIENKRCFQGVVEGGALFVKKTRPNRMQLSDLAMNLVRPTVFTLDPASALDYKFVATSDEVAITTEDGSFIVPDDENRIAYSEIKKAFLSIPSVAPNLAPTYWIKHHFRMIVLKLNWLESLHPGILSPQNVCLQLKYRYDHEIDRAHRLAIQRILECDDSPSKRMVLVVLQIHITQFSTELELSDRWYSVRTVIDAAMQSLVDLGKVQVGTKLMIQSSELLNCEDGCSPLEIPPNVRLKIHTNSTRRARWDTKLGLYKTKKPFLLNLRQVRMNGGLVTKLELCILRVYPSMFLRDDGKDGNGLEFHSEKVEQRLKNLEDVSKLSNIESVFSQLQKELEAEERQPRAKRRKIQGNIGDIVDPEELYNLLQFEGDTSEIEAELSSQQRKLLADYQQQLYTEKMKEVHRRVQDKLHNQPVANRSRELLKLRVTDRRHPETFALLSIWSPHSELKNLFHEERVIEVTHVVPNDHHSSELQLTSTKLSQYRLLPDMHSVSRHLFRRITSIQDIYSPNFKPVFNELDICGLVVLIDDVDPSNVNPQKKHHAKKFQSVFLADSDTNILCLNFWAGVKDYGYEDIIQIHRFVTVNNLQWRSNSANGPIPCVFATVTTTLTEKPKNKDMLHALKNLKAHFADTRAASTQEFAQRCQEKIREIKSRPKSSLNSTLSTTLNASNNLNNSTNNASTYGGSSSSTSMNATASLLNDSSSVQGRIDKLRFYGDAPEVSPLQIKRTRSVRRGFKVPMKMDDDSRNDR